MRAPEKEFCDACSRKRDLRKMALNEHKTFRVRIGQRPQEHSVYYRENGAVDAKAESECEERDQGKGGTFAEHTQPVAEISPAHLQNRFPARRANDFLRAFEIAALQAHGAKRILAAHPLLHSSFGCHVQEVV